MRFLGAVIIAAGIVGAIARPARAAVVVDNFNTSQNYLTNGVSGTIWDGILNSGVATVADANISNAGNLTIRSANGAWQGTGDSGFLLYRNVTGDFTATVEVVGAPYVDYNTAGLMARNPNGTSSTENWIAAQLLGNFNIGSSQRYAVNSADTTVGGGNDLTSGWLELIRAGNSFSTYYSSNDSTWSQLGSTVTLANMLPTLQVGLFQATFSGNTGTAQFANFSLSYTPTSLTTSTWNGTTNSQWSTATNWSASPAPGTGQAALFNNSGNGNTTIDLGGGVTVTSLAFDTSNAAAYTIGAGGAGSQTLTLDSGGTIAISSTVTNSQTINANVVLGSAGGAGAYTFANNSTTGGQMLTLAGTVSSATAGAKSLTVSGAGNTALTGIISDGAAGTVAVTQSGPGTLTLSAANTYSGGTTLTSGVLAVSGNSALGTGTLTLAGGTLQAAGGPSSVANPVTVSGDFAVGGSQALALAGNVNLNNAGHTITVNNSGATTFGGTIANLGAGNFLRKSGPGVLTLTGQSSLSGHLYLDQGSMVIAGTGSLTCNGTWQDVGNEQAGTVTLTVQDSGSFSTNNDMNIPEGTGVNAIVNVQDNGAVTANNVFIGKGSTGTGGTVSLAGGSFTASGQLNLGIFAGTTGWLNVSGGTLTAAGLLGLGNEFYNDQNAGAGVVYQTGGLVMANGGLAIGNQAAGYSATGGTYQLSGGTLVTNAVALGPGGTTLLNFNGGTFRASGGFSLPSGLTTMVQSGGAVFDTNNNTLTIPGNLVQDPNSTGGGLRKTGAGTLALGGANTYTGATTINGGTLALGAGGSISQSSAISVGSGAFFDVSAVSGGFHLASGQTLGGFGTINGAATANAGSLIFAGSGSVPGALTFNGGLSLAGGTLQFALGAPGAAGTTSSLVALPSGVLGGSNVTTLAFNPLSGCAAGTYELIGYGSTSLSLANFATPSIVDGLEAVYSLAPGSLQMTLVTGTGPIWASATGGNWSVAGNWAGGVPNAAGASANLLGSLQSSGTIALDVPVTVGTLQFNNTASYTIGAPGGTNALTLDNSGSAATITLVSGSHAIQAPVVLNSSTTVGITDYTQSLTVGGSISGSGSLTMSGPGTLVLAASNNFGGTVLAGGTLQISGSGTLPRAGVTINAGVLDLGATPQTATAIAINGGVLQNGSLAGTSVNISGGTVQNGSLAGMSVSISGGLVASSGTLNSAGSYSLSGGTVAGVLAGNGASVASGLVVLSGENTFGGGVTLDGGTLNINSDAALGASGGGVTFAANATLQAGAAGIVTGAGRTTTLDYGVAATFDTQNYLLEIAGPITGSGGLVKIGNGTLTIDGTNTYSGGTTLTSGVLAVSGNSALGTGTLTLAGGTLQAAGGPSSVANPVTVSGDFAVGGSQALALAGNVNLNNAGHTITVNNSGATTFGGTIANLGAGNFLRKSGPGVLTLTGQSSLSGHLYLDQGSMVIAGTGSLTCNGTWQDVGNEQAGTVTLTVQDSGSFSTNNDMNIPEGTGVNAIVNVQDNGAVTANNVFIGKGSTGTGGTVSLAGGSFTASGQLNLGIFAGTTGWLNVSGGTLTAAGLLGLGNEFYNDQNAGAGVVYQTGGLVMANGGLAIGNQAAGYSATGGTYQLSGGTLVTNAVALGPGGTTLLNFNGGTFRASGGFSLPSGLTTMVQSGGAVFDTNNNTLTIPGNLVQDPNSTGGGLRKTGAGTLALGGANTYTGATTINGGTLALGAGGSISQSSAISVGSGAFFDVSAVSGGFHLASGQTLGGFGTINGAATANAGSLIFAGSGSVPGALTFNGGLSLAGGTLQFALGAPGAAGTTSSLVALPSGVLGGSNVTTLAFNPLSGCAAGTYELIGYGSTSLSLANFATPSIVDGLEAVYSLAPGSLQMTLVTGTGPIWASATGGNWSVAGNWAGGVPNAAGASANLLGSLQSSGTIALDVPVTVGTLQFNNTASYTIGAPGGTNALTLDNSGSAATITLVSGSHAIQAPVVLNSSTTVGITDYTQSLTVGGSISGSGSLTMSGPGTLVLAASANTYSGPTTINAGSLYVSGQLTASTVDIEGGKLVLSGTVGGNVTMSAGGIDDNGGTPVISGSVAVTGNSTWYSGLATAAGGITVQSGNFAVGDAAVLTTPTLTISGGSFSAVSRAGVLSGSLNYTSPASSTFQGQIVGGANGVMLNSSSATLTLSGSNSYGGATTVNGGVLYAGAAEALSPNSVNYVGNNGTPGTLDVTTGQQSIAALTVGGSGTLNISAANLLSIAGAATFAAGSTIDISGTSSIASLPWPLLAYSGFASGTFTNVLGLPNSETLAYRSGSLDIVSSGPPTWQFANSGSWTNGDNWSNGTPPSGIGAMAIIGAATNSPLAITLDSPQTLGVLTFTNTAGGGNGYALETGVSGSLTLANSGSAAQIIVNNGMHAITAPVDLVGGDLQVSASNNGVLTIAGNISEDTTRNLVLNGDGTGELILSGTNTLGGPLATATVSSGTLVLNDPQALTDGTNLTIGNALVFGGIQPAGVPEASLGKGSLPIAPVPEPDTLMLLLSAGLAAIAVWRKQRKNRG